MILEVRAVEPFLRTASCSAARRLAKEWSSIPVTRSRSCWTRSRRHRLQIRYILLTHAHLDHITGVGRAKAALTCRWACTRRTISSTAPSCSRASAFGIQDEPQPPVDFFYEGEDPLRFGQLCHPDPPHARPLPRRCLPEVGRDDESGRILFVGDTLFAGSIGRTDLPGGDTETLLRSIRDVLLPIPTRPSCYSGHGRATTIGHERRTNPFLHCDERFS